MQHCDLYFLSSCFVFRIFPTLINLVLCLTSSPSECPQTVETSPTCWSSVLHRASFTTAACSVPYKCSRSQKVITFVFAVVVFCDVTSHLVEGWRPVSRAPIHPVQQWTVQTEAAPETADRSDVPAVENCWWGQADLKEPAPNCSGRFAS